MSELPAAVREAFDAHAAFERAGDGYGLSTTVLEASVGVAAEGGSAPQFVVKIRAPTLDAAAADEVGEAVAEGWFETFSRRLEDAPMATRVDVALDWCDVALDGEMVVAELAFRHGRIDQVPGIAKAFVEYAEGTYVEGVVPGYDYGEPVATLLGEATQAGGGDRGGTPL